MNASGFLPVDWTAHSIPRDRNLLVEMQLDDASLKLLSAFAGEAIKGQAGGSLSGQVSYSGTIESPILQGGLKWRDGSIQLAGLNSLFEQIEADVTLSGHTLSVDGLTGRSAEGGSFGISGAVDLAEMKPKLDLTLATSRLRVSGKDISARYGESIDAVLDSNLRITGAWLEPRIAGEIAVPQGALGLGCG
jgi:autotransporter translocation and assembly factor TamB